MPVIGSQLAKKEFQFARNERKKKYYAKRYAF